MALFHHRQNLETQLSYYRMEKSPERRVHIEMNICVDGSPLNQHQISGAYPVHDQRV